MSDKDPYAVPNGPTSYLTWPLQLISGRYDWNYDWHYLSDADRRFLIPVAGHAGLFELIFVFAICDYKFAQWSWREFATFEVTLVVLFALLTWVRIRLHRAAVRAAARGDAQRTNEWRQILKDFVEFFAFP